LGFALALGADAATLFAEVCPGADEPGEGIFHAGENDLQPFYFLYRVFALVTSR
jgi:hypothetical protein